MSPHSCRVNEVQVLFESDELVLSGGPTARRLGLRPCSEVAEFILEAVEGLVLSGGNKPLPSLVSAHGASVNLVPVEHTVEADKTSGVEAVCTAEGSADRLVAGEANAA